MQRNPQTPHGQRPAARPQQAYSTPQRPAARPQQGNARSINRPQQQSGTMGARPVNRPQQPPVRTDGRPMNSARQPSVNPGVANSTRPVQRPVPAQNGRPAPQQRKPLPQRLGQSSQRPAQPQRRPAAPTGGMTFRGSRDSKIYIIAAIAIVLTLGIGCLMQYVVYPNGYFPSDTAKAVTAVAEIASSKGVRINEVMSSNKTALSDEDGSYPDWIELINASDSSVDISGWALLDKASRSTYFTFPDYQLEPGETVLVYASGQLANENGAAFHAPFRLSSTGDTLMLSDAHSTVIESINIPALGANQSYAQKDGGWAITSEYTPGLENTTLNYAMLTSTQPISDASLVITEVMADNASYPATDGGLYDWIEIQNIGANAVDLSGYGLSDSESKPSQWKFPSVAIQPGECLIVYASGLGRQGEDGSLHANFGLRAEGEGVLLYNQSGQVLDYVEFDNLKSDQSLKRQADGSYTTSGTATPGQAN